MSYQSPIEIVSAYAEISDNIQRMTEDNIVWEVKQKMGINIDKEELKRALAYDRRQYEKGYQDAERTYKAPEAEWILNENGWNTICNHCEQGVWRGYVPKPSEAAEWMPRCPQCGAIMKRTDGDPQEVDNDS